MASSWHQKRAKQAEFDFEKALQTREDEELAVSDLVKDAAMGGGDSELFEKKLSKEEKKAQAKAKREAKRKSKGKGKKNDEPKEEAKSATEVLSEVNTEVLKNEDGINHEAADVLATAGTICTFSSSRKGVDARARDINVTNFTLQHMGQVLLDECEVVLNHGNRYGLIGLNGCGKSTLLKALGARAIPIPNSIDIFFLKEEVEPSDTMTALDAVMSVDEERLKLEQQAEDLNTLLGDVPEDGDPENEKTSEEIQEDIMEALNLVYGRLDALDAATAEVRARSILAGLGFTHDMQSKLTKDFSGGWRMRVSLARALFIQPVWCVWLHQCLTMDNLYSDTLFVFVFSLLLDEPTNHLDMEAVIWLEDYLSRWNRILLLVSHSQDFLNNVCSHMVHFTSRRKLVYYDGNYDQFMKTKSEKEENQWKQYRWEQEQIKSMKEYIARFGHGTAKNAKQAQSKEKVSYFVKGSIRICQWLVWLRLIARLIKVLAKMVRAGLTQKPEEEKPLNFKFPDPGHLPPPVLAFHDVSFGYPGCEPLYTNVNFGVDLDSRVALVGPNGKQCKLS